MNDCQPMQFFLFRVQFTFVVVVAGLVLVVVAAFFAAAVVP